MEGIYSRMLLRLIRLLPTSPTWSCYRTLSRGKCSWRRQDIVVKVRIRNTARVIQTKSSGNAPKVTKNTSKEKVCQDFNANNCKSRGDTVVVGIIVKHACSYCYTVYTVKMYSHIVQDCFRRTTDQAKDSEKNS